MHYSELRLYLPGAQDFWDHFINVRYLGHYVISAQAVLAQAFEVALFLAMAQQDPPAESAHFQKFKKAVKDAFALFDKIGNDTVPQDDVGTIMRLASPQI